MTWLAKGIGYDAVAVSGYIPSTSGGRLAHGWCEVTIDGVEYIIDGSLGHSYTTKNFYMRTYSSAPVTYYILSEATDC